MPTTLHESPSGSPVVIPDPPAPAVVPRFRRLVSGINGGINILNVTADLEFNVGAGPFTIEFLNPRPDRVYSARATCRIVFSAGAGVALAWATGGVTLHLLASVDGGPFVVVAEGATNISAPHNVVVATFMPVETGLRDMLGAALGITALSTSLRFQLQASGSGPAGGEMQVNSSPFSETAGGTLLLEGTES